MYSNSRLKQNFEFHKGLQYFVIAFEIIPFTWVSLYALSFLNSFFFIFIYPSSRC